MFTKESGKCKPSMQREEENLKILGEQHCFKQCLKWLKKKPQHFKIVNAYYFKGLT